MSFQGLVAILRYMRQTAAEERQKPLVECPYCGERLDVRGGTKNCPLGHYRTTRATREQ